MSVTKSCLTLKNDGPPNIRTSRWLDTATRQLTLMWTSDSVFCRPGTVEAASRGVS